MPTEGLITFDLDDTLWELAPAIRRANAAMMAWLAERAPALAEHFEPDDWRALQQELVAAHPHLRVHLSMMRRMLLTEALKRTGHDHDTTLRLAAGAFHVFLEARSDVTLFAGVQEVLESLKPRYRLGVITNGNANLRRIGIDGLFDFVLHAESVGFAKPDPHIFYEALHLADVEPERAVHVGDDLEKDVEAARAIGIHPVWVNMLGAQSPPPPDTPVLHDLRQLPGIVTELLSG